MKQKILDSIKDFYNLCYTMFNLSAGDFAKNNFPVIVEKFWDENKGDEDNLKSIKSAFELEKRLQESNGGNKAAEVIAVFQEGWLNKIN
jgi:hypothetical protein